MATACTNSLGHVGASRAAERLSSSRSSYVSTAPVSVISRRRVAKKVETAIIARLRPGRQGVQRIYRMATEKSQINVYEYLESIGVPRAQALQVMSQASASFEREAVRRGLDPGTLEFGANEMRAVVEYLMGVGVTERALGELVVRHPAVLAYDVESRLEPLFAYMESTFERNATEFISDIARRPSLLGLDANENAQRMVGYLLSNGSSKEEALEYLLRTL